MSEIQEVFQGSNVFITGGTGFLGQVLMEKLLRTCHDLEAIYLLVRPKKGKNEEERIQKLFDGHLYERLKQERPDYHKKVHLISGDCSCPSLGISEKDRELLKQKINFMFHVAATVRFDEELHKAFAINVQGTKEIMNLAKELCNLKGIVHMSTAYSNCTHRDVDEAFYKPGMLAGELEQLMNSVDVQTLNALTPVILDEWPNTYTFTKSIAEDVVKDMAPGLPVAIVRPSIVISTWAEPISSWINNMYGITGFAYGCAQGLIRVGRTEPHTILDIVPADLVVNNTIAAAWHVAKTRPTNVVIYNYVSSTTNPVTFRMYEKYTEEGGILVPSILCIWYYSLIYYSNYWVYKILILLLHTIPGILVDIAAVLIGEKPRLMRGYIRIHKFLALTVYFALNEWKFRTDNVQALWNNLNKTDKQLFFFDISVIDWPLLLFYILRGLRLYVAGDSFDTLPIAKVKYNRLKYMHYTVVYGIRALVIWYGFKVLTYCYQGLISILE